MAEKDGGKPAQSEGDAAETAKPKRRAPAKRKAKPGGAKGTGNVKRETAAAKRKRLAAARKAQHDLESDPAAAVEALSGAAKTVETAELYMDLFSSWLRGMTPDALSAKHGLSIRRINEVIASLRQHRLTTTALNNPLYGSQLARDLVLRHQARVSEYAELADKVTDEKLMHVKLGFLKRRDESLDEFRDLMQELGYLPKHLGTLRVQEDFMGMVDELLEGMQELGVDEQVQRALVERVELRVQRQRDGRLRLAEGSPIDAEVVSEEEVQAA